MPSNGACDSGARIGAGILGNRGRESAVAATAASAASHSAAVATATAATINGGSHEDAATPPSGPPLIEEYIRAITDAMESVISTKISSAVKDVVLHVLSEHVKPIIKDTLYETMAGDVVPEVSEGVAATLSEDMAPQVVEMVKKDMESTVRPILDAVAGVTTALQEHTPEFGALMSGVNAPVLAAIASQQHQTTQAVVTYESMSFETIRWELNIHAKTRHVRRAEAVVANKRVKRLAATPAAQKDFLTWLTPQPRHGGTSNKIPIHNSNKLTYGAIQTLLRKVHFSGVVPDIFRNWKTVSSTDSLVRHAAFVSHRMGSRHDPRANARGRLYSLILYCIFLASCPGFYIDMRDVVAKRPNTGAAAGSAYLAYEKSAVMCELGRLIEDGDEDGEPQGTGKRTIRGCIRKGACEVVSEFFKGGAGCDEDVLLPVAKNFRTMILGVGLKWH